ncbi:radical SAM/SPASM domain-containing protein [Terasakiella sp. A23]|uniref:radical SAM/SPASM domain-containing protein n=1 Tax=Terasakiella sp. FCG-A23 TaxID=3080561 RepID=UPI0029531932|nr:radical SAM/SPASM domain-containing protein [Terasakiella sp. A23]MDV7340816.1 radical SAM/SPASM domain-containing protein [Terasakiella sp. A23]
MEQKTYKKDNSFVGLSGIDTETSDILKRIQTMADRLDSYNWEDGQQELIMRAVSSLSAGKGNSEDNFWLRPHIVEEINRLSDEELPRYLYYRFRYDVFPSTHELDAFPPCVQIEPTSVCNYRCVFCYQTDKKLTDSKAGHKGRMDLDLFKKIVDQIHGRVEAVTLASRGEPLLAKDIVKMLEYASGKFLGLKVNTNAWYLTEEKIHALLSAEPNTVVFSADAADDELYAKLRVNGRLDKVLKNVQMFSDIKAKHYSQSRTITRVSGVKFSDQQDFDKIESFWKDYVDQVAFVDYNPWESVYDAEATNVSQPCSDLWRRLFVWWDGRINPCDVDYLSSLAVGNVKDKDISELWTGEGYDMLRQQHLAGNRDKLMPCVNCSLV